MREYEVEDILGDAFQVREPYWQYDNGQLRLAI
jgi:hypothetical protein